MDKFLLLIAVLVLIVLGIFVFPIAVIAKLIIALYDAISKKPKPAPVAAEPELPENVRPIRPSPVDNFLKRQTSADKSGPLGLGDVEIPPIHKKRVVISLDEIKKTASELQYPYEGKCACRTIYLGSYGVLKDVTVRCERCDQPFVFKYPL